MALSLPTFPVVRFTCSPLVIRPIWQKKKKDQKTEAVDDVVNITHRATNNQVCEGVNLIIDGPINVDASHLNTCVVCVYIYRKKFVLGIKPDHLVKRSSTRHPPPHQHPH